jgi:protein O-GlcNAc transferase
MRVNDQIPLSAVRRGHALAIVPGMTPTGDLQQLFAPAAAAQAAGRLAEAERLYRAALARAPVPEMLVNHGNLLVRLGRPGEALARYDQALAGNGALVPALYNRGNLLSDLKRFEEALVSFDLALAHKRDLVGIWNNRGTALRSLRRLDDAMASIAQALALAPGHVNALTNRAMLLWDMKRFDDALAAVDRVLALQPGFGEALYLRGNILTDLGQMDAALESYEAALAASPDHPHALNGVARTALALCDWTRVAKRTPQLVQAVQAGGAVIQPFTLLGFGDDAALQRRCAETYMQRIQPSVSPLAQGRYGHAKIRLAYLSADFHQHPTAQLLVELFERHDRSRFEVTAMAFGPDDGSAMRARLVKAFDRFEDVRGISDLAVAQRMAALEIDIAVDLNGHTQDARPGIFAHRPAPMQVNYLVYPGTTGAAFMDVVLADRTVLPPDQQPFFRERIVHLPDCYQANDATRDIPLPPTRGEAGLPQTGFVFCCFNNGWKITAPVFDIWMRLLDRVDGSILWLLDGPHAGNLRQQAQARGIDPARLVFASKVAPPQHLARHRLADLFLDTLPYNAHTTASDALYAGLPLVTCVGKAFPGRVAASLLKAIDMPELVTTSPGQYEELALELARNPALLAATRAKLARNRTTTALLDSARFRQAIEGVFIQLAG